MAMAFSWSLSWRVLLGAAEAGFVFGVVLTSLLWIHERAVRNQHCREHQNDNARRC